MRDFLDLFAVTASRGTFSRVHPRDKLQKSVTFSKNYSPPSRAYRPPYERIVLYIAALSLRFCIILCV